MRIALFCATRRGLLFLKKLKEVAPAAELIVFSFKEEAHEPRFLEDIRRTAEEFGGRLFEVKRGGADDVGEALEDGFDLLFAVSWRYLIPKTVYERARIGSFALHDSLLPKYRGFSPTVWAIINGENETGATLFEMTEKADEGAILDQETVEILESETIAEVMERVTGAYLKLLEHNISGILTGKWTRREQDHSAATYCRKRKPMDNWIDWGKTSREVMNLVRAVTRPYPGAFTIITDDPIVVDVGKRLLATVWSVARVDGVADSERTTGRVVEVGTSGCIVLTGDGALRVMEMQLEGDRARPAVEVIGRVGMMLR